MLQSPLINASYCACVCVCTCVRVCMLRVCVLRVCAFVRVTVRNWTRCWRASLHHMCASAHECSRAPCNTLQHAATHCNTLQHTTTRCNTWQHTATHGNTWQHTTTHCTTVLHNAPRCNTLQHTATRVLECIARAAARHTSTRSIEGMIQLVSYEYWEH